MPRENVQLSTNLSMPLAFDGSERRSVTSYERELTGHRATEVQLRRPSPSTRLFLLKGMRRSASRRS